jgi:hypothetical protein
MSAQSTLWTFGSLVALEAEKGVSHHFPGGTRWGST